MDIKKLQEKLNNLDEKFNTDLDIISLKALCGAKETKEIQDAISIKLNTIFEKYSEDIEILNLLPIEKINYHELKNYLNTNYSTELVSFRIKALLNLKENKERELLIMESIEELYEKYPEDKFIMKSLGYPIKVENKNMVFVRGGEYHTSTSYSNDVIVKIIDLYVNKYITTQKEWREIFGEYGTYDLKRDYSENNHSNTKGENKPITNLNRYAIYEYCNRLSIKHGYKPVYKIEWLDQSLNKKPKVSIIQIDGKEVNPSIADFEKTEGYRLPTSLEWEWFANGGKLDDEKKLIYSKKDKDTFKELGWFKNNSNTGGFMCTCCEPQDVGLKKPNEFGIYDYIGNVNQLVFDTEYGGWSSESYGTPYKTISHVYDESNINIYISRGGYFNHNLSEGHPYNTLFRFSGDQGSSLDGFRIVRTARPKRK